MIPSHTAGEQSGTRPLRRMSTPPRIPDVLSISWADSLSTVPTATTTRPDDDRGDGDDWSHVSPNSYFAPAPAQRIQSPARDRQAIWPSPRTRKKTSKPEPYLSLRLRVGRSLL